MKKNLLIWTTIIAISILLFNLFGHKEPAPVKATEISFSDFLKRVENGDFKEVSLETRTISAEIPAPPAKEKKDEKLEKPAAKPEETKEASKEPQSSEAKSTKAIFNLLKADGFPKIEKPASEKYFAYHLLSEESIKRLLTSKANIKVLPPKEEGFSFYTFLSMFGNFLWVIVLILIFLNLRNSGGMGGMMRGKKSAQNPEGRKVTFADVAGVDEAKEEVAEIVDFLKDPKKFNRLGGRIPKGVLLVGPPGTGKTLLARAIAGEAGVPFLSMAGSDFVEMFVGVGASRVRELFDDAKKLAPCIIFIDEIDSIGGKRTNEYGGGREYAQTLNQLLTEMDGFNTNEGVIVIAATNRADILDEALLRPGRFDRQVYVTLPDLAGREAILKIHLQKIKISEDVDARYIARGTVGFSGADLANLVNEAALMAARTNKIKVTAADFDLARDKILMGAEHRSRSMSKEEILKTARHEAGHAICFLKVPSADPIHKATIIPRGGALGMVQPIAENDKVSQTYEYIRSDMIICMGGRAAEEIFNGLNKVTTGAISDIQQATHLATQAIKLGGLSKKLGMVAYTSLNGSYGDDFRLSDETKRKIDEEIKTWIDEAYAEAKKIITKFKKETEAIAQALVEFETLSGDEIKQIVAGKKITRVKLNTPTLMKSSLPITKQEEKIQENPVRKPKKSGAKPAKKTTKK